MKDWSIEQLREIEMALRNAREKQVHLNGKLCIVNHMMLIQPALIANHPGRALEIDMIDAHGDKHEIRLYTSEWPEDKRKT